MRKKGEIVAGDVAMGFILRIYEKCWLYAYFLNEFSLFR